LYKVSCIFGYASISLYNAAGWLVLTQTQTK